MSHMLITGGSVDIAIKTKLYARAGLASVLGLGMLFSVGSIASGQTTQPTQPAPPTTTSPNPPSAQPVGPTPRWTPPDDITRREIVDMDHFLDSHPEIAEQLRRDPSLIDNREWVAHHPALQEYLHSHQRLAGVFRAHPEAFMRDEDRYEQTEGDRDHDRDRDQDRDHDRVTARDRDNRNRGELTSFGQFLGGHTNVASELSADPTLATNKEYLATHPELDEYLKAHPAMSQQLAENPQGVMSSEPVQTSGGFGAKPVGPTPRPKAATPNQ
jgi:hypothetical protein